MLSLPLFATASNGEFQEITSLSPSLLLTLLALLSQHYTFRWCFDWYSHHPLWGIKRQLHMFNESKKSSQFKSCFFYSIFVPFVYNIWHAECWQSIVYPILIDYVKQSNIHEFSHSHMHQTVLNITFVAALCLSAYTIVSSISILSKRFEFHAIQSFRLAIKRTMCYNEKSTIRMRSLRHGQVRIVCLNVKRSSK